MKHLKSTFRWKLQHWRGFSLTGKYVISGYARPANVNKHCAMSKTKRDNDDEGER